MIKNKLLDSSRYVTNSNHNALSLWIIIFLIIVLLVLLGILSGVGTVIVILGSFIAFLVLSHIIVKLSAVFQLKSKTPFDKDTNYHPFVSIHIACKSEPSEVVNKTVAAMTKLNYPNYEVIVINSNNTDSENWHKIQKYVKSCGPNYKFVHLDKVSGFKAGALNYLNNNYLDNKVEIIAIVDSDYIVTPDFLKKMVIYFNNPEVGLVQAPQCYSNVNSNNIGLLYEYRSFFAIVMHQAQRLNLVTFLGTMGLIRASLLEKGLKWNEWCITEDVEAGVYINCIGYSGVYVDECLGKGLMPFDYASLIKQRQRWAFGNMQIIKKDLFSVILNTNRALSARQKFAFLAQLVTWFHFELVIAVVYLILNSAILFGYSTPSIILANNLMLLSLVTSLIGNLLYFIIGLRKEASPIERLKALLIHYGLLYTMSSSWVTCLLGRKLGFNVTKKEKSNNGIPFSQYGHEFIIIILLLVGLGIAFINGSDIRFGAIVIITSVIIELLGIKYLYESFKEPTKKITKG